MDDVIIIFPCLAPVRHKLQGRLAQTKKSNLFIKSNNKERHFSPPLSILAIESTIMKYLASWNLPFLLFTLWWQSVSTFTARSVPLSSRRYAPPLYAESYQVTVQYEGKSCDIEVRRSETILEALERAGAAAVLALPEMPSQCRRGNCMTCSAKFIDNDQRLVVSSDDGLSPEVSRQVKKCGYVLTCSSYVQGDGLTIELDQNHGLWDIVYRQRFESDSTRTAARAALARLLRRNAENNIEKWTLEVEAMLEKSGNDDV